MRRTLGVRGRVPCARNGVCRRPRRTARAEELEAIHLQLARTELDLALLKPTRWSYSLSDLYLALLGPACWSLSTSRLILALLGPTCWGCPLSDFNLAIFESNGRRIQAAILFFKGPFLDRVWNCLNDEASLNHIRMGR